MANGKKIAYYAERAGHSLPKEVRKRDGRVASFDLARIELAVERCFETCETAPKAKPIDVAENVGRAIAARTVNGDAPSIEAIQDAVEFTLQSMGEYEAARLYILYRERHAQERALRTVPVDVKAAFGDAAQYFPTQAQQFMFFDKYSKYNYDLGRRETWIETVDRSVDFLRELSDNKLDHTTYGRIYNFILNMKAMPSMRLLATAGDYARSNNIALYNCSALPVKDIEAFCEALLISMSGTGVGYSVESYYVEQFPRIKRQKKNQVVETHVVEDSTDGWIRALGLGLTTWWAGEDVEFDFSLIRRAGLPLRGKGGRASGPGPLRDMLQLIRTKILARQGSFIRTIDAHDMMCSVGDAAVQGGVRRSAMLCLFDWDDIEMRNCKTGVALDNNPVRWNANNSAVWPEHLTQQELIQQMLDMDLGQRGEPGIFSRENMVRTRPKRRKSSKFQTNPCGEIALRPYQFCNLSIAVARVDDTPETLREKVEIATIIGTIQSMATHFPGLRPEWKQNCEEERLLGVDITGQQDCPIIQNGELMRELRDYAIEVNVKYAEKLGINPSAAVTCNKPSGNSSQLLDCASGIHARHAAYYVRNMRVSAHSPVARAMQEAGVPLSPENGQTLEDVRTWVVPFPMKAPEGARLRDQMSAIDQLEYWLMCKTEWTEHNPSATISYGENELLDVVKWVWEHKDMVGGLSFLPRSDPQYQQLPYQTISKEEYEERLAAFPIIDFSAIYRYELADMTTATSELACFAGQCDV